VSAVGLFLLLTASAAQDAEQRLATCLAQSYPGVDEARRGELAARLSRGIQTAADSYGHSADRVLGFVEQKLQSGSMKIDLVEEQARGLAKAAAPWISDATSRLALPPAYAERTREATFAAVDAYVSEVVARPAATDDEKRAVCAQYARVADEIREIARSKISGPYRDAVIDQYVGALLQSQTGPRLGDPVSGMLARPLSATDLERILSDVRARAASEKPVEASSPEDRRFGEKGAMPNELSPALESVQRMAQGIYLLGGAAYPRAMAAFEEQDRALHEAIAWIDEAWAPIEKDLAQRHAEFRPPKRSVATSAVGPPARRGAASGSPDSEPASRAPALPPAEQTSPSGSPRRFGILAALLACALLGAWLWRRSRAA
jgi:hypothetical protein